MMRRVYVYILTKGTLGCIYALSSVFCSDMVSFPLLQTGREAWLRNMEVKKGRCQPSSSTLRWEGEAFTLYYPCFLLPLQGRPIMLLAVVHSYVLPKLAL